MTAAPRRGVRREKSLDLDDVFGGFGSNKIGLNKTTPHSAMYDDNEDNKSISHIPRKFTDDLAAADMSDCGRSVSSVSSTRSHSRRGSRSRAVVDRTRSKSKGSFSSLNKSGESGLFSYLDKEGGSDEEDENLLFGDAEKAGGHKNEQEPNSACSAIASTKKDVALDRKKLRERMRRERTGAESPMRNRDTDKERSSKKDSEKDHHADTEQFTEKERRAAKEERRAKRRLRKEKEESEQTEPAKRLAQVIPIAAPYRSKTEKKKDKEQAILNEKYSAQAIPTAMPYRSKTEKKKDKEAEQVFPTAVPYRSKTEKKKDKEAEQVIPAAMPYRSKTEKKKDQEAEQVFPTAMPYRSKTEKKKDKEAEQVIPTAMPYRSKTEKKKDKEKEQAISTPDSPKTEKKKTKEKKRAAKAAAENALDGTKRHENLSPVKPKRAPLPLVTKQSKSEVSPSLPTAKSSVKRTQSPKVDHAEEEEKKEENPLEKLLLRRPSLKGDQSPRSTLNEAQNSWAEEASRASTQQSGTTDDSDDDASDDGTVLQFDPSQVDNVYRVRQIKRDDSVYSIMNKDGTIVTGHIGEINDSLAGLPAVESSVKRIWSLKVDHAEGEAKKEEKPLQKLLLRRPSLIGDQYPRSLIEAENSGAEEATRASTQQSGTTDDSDDHVSDDGTVLQVNPSQVDNVYLVSQIKREDSVGSLSGLPAFQASVKRTRSLEVDHAEEEAKKNENPLQKVLLRRPSLIGDRYSRSLTEAENPRAEEATRASTQQSGTTDDSDDNVSDDGTVLQFNPPSQVDNVYRVSQVKREDYAYSNKNKDGTIVTDHIAGVNGSLSGSENDDIMASGGEENSLSYGAREAREMLGERVDIAAASPKTLQDEKGSEWSRTQSLERIVLDPETKPSSLFRSSYSSRKL